jgi:hypothetical protein
MYVRGEVAADRPRNGGGAQEVTSEGEADPGQALAPSCSEPGLSWTSG